jgi:antitoxin Phd
MDWQLADAKNRFSELVTRALSEGPQRVTRRRDRVIVMAERDYQRLIGKRRSFIDYLMRGPSFEGLDLTRDQSPGRDIKL